MKGSKQSLLYQLQQKGKIGGECKMCKRVRDSLTVDHIVPVSFLQAVGLEQYIKYEDADNFQLLCRTCNSLKGNRFDFTNPKTLENLKKYIKLLETLHN